MSRWFRTIAIAALLVALPNVAHAQRVSEEADIGTQGTLEVETDYAHDRGAEGVTNSSAVQVKYSITDALQLQLGTNNLVAAGGDDGAHLLDGVFFGPKLLLREETEHAPSLAVSALMMLPTHAGDEALAHTVDAYLWAYASKEMLGVKADLNLGLDVLSIDDRAEAQLHAAVAVTRELAEDLAATLEAHMCQAGGAYAEHDAGALVSLAYEPAPWLKLEAGADVGLYDDARSLTVFTAVTVIPYHGQARAERAELASR